MDKVYEYFVFFQYLPLIKELWFFYPQKISQVELIRQLKKNNYQIQQDRIFKLSDKKYLQPTLKRKKISQTKLNKRKTLIQWLGRLPWVQFMGISGTVSMNNAQVDDDIDIFIITTKNRLWLARFLLIIMTSLLNVRRKPHDRLFKDKLCLNLFFSEANLKIPDNKQNRYIGHEILQLLPMVNKNQTYENFQLQNQWVRKMFPNSEKKDLRLKIQDSRSKNRNSVIGDWLERILKSVQLNIITKHKTNEIITDTQLWFFPADFEKQLAKYL